MVLQRQRGEGHDHGHIALGGKAGRKGDLHPGIAEEGEHACRSRAVCPPSTRKTVAWIIPLEVGRNFLRVGTNREHESDTRHDDRGHEDPRERERIKAQRTGQSLGGRDQNRSAKRAYERPGQHVPKPLRALTRWVHVGGRYTQLIAGAHPAPKTRMLARNSAIDPESTDRPAPTAPARPRRSPRTTATLRPYTSATLPIG
jgi:hypothetical protein